MDVGDLYRFIGDGPSRATLARLAGWDIDALTPEQAAELDRQEAELKGAPKGRALGPYVLVEKLGEGATSEVWKAWDPKLRRWVAVKEARVESKERFLREARAASKVRHPHLIEALDVGDGWLAMTLVDGLSLDRVKHDARSAAAAMADVAGAVQALHDAGMIHRDIKPSNILQDREGRAILADFGIAKDLAAPALTLEGTLLGTPNYMAPEQAKGQAAGPAADIYGLGATLYHLAGGVPPFAGETLPGILASLAEKAPAPPRVPAPLAGVLARAMAKRPEDRYPSATAFAEDLGRFLRGEPVSRRPFRVSRRAPLWLAGAALLVAGLLWSRSLTEASALYADGVERWARGDLAGAEALFAKAGERPEAMLMRGRCLLRMGKPAEARALWDRLLARDPGYGPALIERGKLNVADAIHQRVPAAGRRSRGVLRFVSPPVADPDLARAVTGSGLDMAQKWFVVGIERLKSGDAAGAAKTWASYAKVNAWDADAHSLHAAAAFLAGDYAEAEEALTRAIEIEPKVPRYLARGDARLAGGRHEAALEDYARAGDEARRGLALQALGRLEEAEAAFGKAPPSARVLVNRGSLRAERRNLAGAKADFEAALELDERNADAYHNLANLSFLERQFDDALRHYDLALACDPDFEEALLGRARARLSLGQPEAALLEFEKIDPRRLHPDNLVELARLYWATGQKAKALATLDRVDGRARTEWRTLADDLRHEWSK